LYGNGVKTVSAARLVDIAEKAGVSVATVSRALSNGRPKGTAKTYHAVIQAARDVGYKVDTHESRPLLENAACITVGMHREGDGSFDCDMGYTPAGFFGRFIYGVERGTQRYEAHLGLFNLNRSPDLEGQIRQIVQKKQINGIVLIVSDDLGELTLPADLCPIVYLNSSPILEIENLDTVASDDVCGVQMVVKRLVELGHRKIAFWKAVPTGSHQQCRLEGYRNQTLAMGLKYERVYYEEKENYPDLPFLERMAISFQHQYLQDKDKPTAIITGNDIFAYVLIRLAVQHGIRIPQDLSLFGFDNIDASAHTCPSLSSVVLNMEGMGYEAVRMLVRRLEEPSSPCCRVILPAKLVERESIGTALW
jgi:DNA-binding LacI/PurR family transcriptional regulator